MTAVLVDADLTEAQARELVGRIGAQLERVWDDVKLAFDGKAWIALGYATWPDLCEAEFGTAQIKLPKARRKEVVADLRDYGMSTRAIAAAVGSSQAGVRKDLESTEQKCSVTGIDGRTYGYSPKPEEIIDAEIVGELTQAQIAESIVGKPYDEMTTRERSMGSSCGVDMSEYTLVKMILQDMTRVTERPIEPENRKKLIKAMRKALAILEGDSQ